MADPYQPTKPGYNPYDPIGPQLTNSITALLIEAFDTLKKCYEIIDDKEGIVPEIQSFENLPDAILSIPSTLNIYRGMQEPPADLGERNDLYFQDL